MKDFFKEYKNYIIIIGLIILCIAIPRFGYILLVSLVVLLALFGALIIVAIDYLRRHGTDKFKEKLIELSNWVKNQK